MMVLSSLKKKTRILLAGVLVVTLTFFILSSKPSSIKIHPAVRLPEVSFHRNLNDRMKQEIPKAVNVIEDPESVHGHYIVEGMKSHNDPSLHQGHRDVFSNITQSNNTDCPKWARFAPKPPYFLTAVLLMRIYEKDKAKLTTREVKMWLEYLRYAGVEHVYVYDAWVYENESQQTELKAFIDDGYVTYIDWHTYNPYTIAGTQVASYQDCIDKYSHENEWQTAIDIDEYPFSPVDTEPGFLYRYIKHYSRYHEDTSELTMQNYLFLGKPHEKELMIEKLTRRTHKPANPLVKPIYKPSNVRAQVHHNGLKSGRSHTAPDKELRMNHYWGARLQNWGDDTPEILAKTEQDDGMVPIINAFKVCEQYVRQYLE